MIKVCAKDSMNIKEEESGGWCQKKWKLGKVFQDGEQLIKEPFPANCAFVNEEQGILLM